MPCSRLPIAQMIACDLYGSNEATFYFFLYFVLVDAAVAGCCSGDLSLDELEPDVGDTLGDTGGEIILSMVSLGFTKNRFGRLIGNTNLWRESGFSEPQFLGVPISAVSFSNVSQSETKLAIAWDGLAHAPCSK